jgi:hypothetical protein
MKSNKVFSMRILLYLKITVLKNIIRKIANHFNTIEDLSLPIEKSEIKYELSEKI